MKQILCFAADRWQSDPTRAQHLLSAFPESEILYLQPGSPSGHRIRRQVGKQFYIDSLPHIPEVDAEHPHIGGSTHRRLVRHVQKVIEEHSFSSPLLWLCSPLYAELLDEIPHSGLIYDCDRDWSQLPIEWESLVTCRADIVFAASPGLQEHLSPCNDNILVVPNGINFETYDAVRTNDFLCPPDMLHCPAPVFGYVGTIWSNLDLAPVEAAAQAHPEWSFVLIGKISRKNRYVARLRQLDNVYLLGPRNAADIPAYTRHFTAGMMLLRDGMEDNDILSPRVYEYMAQGLPIAAMYHHLQREAYPTLIDSAYSVPRFVEMCEKIAADDPTEKKVERYRIAAQSDWSCRCRQATEAIRASQLLEEMDLTRSVEDGRDWFAD